MKTVIVTMRIEPKVMDFDLEVPLDMPAARIVESLCRALSGLGVKKPTAPAWMLVVGLDPKAPYLLGGDTVAEAGLVDGGYLRLLPCEQMREATYVVPTRATPSPAAKPTPGAEPKRRANPFVVAYRSASTQHMHAAPEEDRDQPAASARPAAPPPVNIWPSKPPPTLAPAEPEPTFTGSLFDLDDTKNFTGSLFSVDDPAPTQKKSSLFDPSPTKKKPEPPPAAEPKRSSGPKIKKYPGRQP